MFSELIDNITNIQVFTDSVKTYFETFSFNGAIVTLMTVFMVIGAVDKIRGNKKGYGQAFDEGFMAMGPLAIAMVGAIAAAPVLCMILAPVITPVYELLGASPAVFATTLLASDMGGYSLAVSMAGDDVVMANFAGLVVGTTMGCIILFDIPVALAIVKEDDRPILSFGILLGLVTAPLGCLAGGLLMNFTPYKMSLITVILNVIPVALVAIIIALGLWFKPLAMMRGFNKFGNGVTAFIAIFVVIAVFQYQTGIRFPLFNIMVEANENGVVPLEDSLMIVGKIGLVLIGAFPMVEWIKKAFRKPLMKIGEKCGINETASAGMVANLANNIPLFNMFHEMNPKGKLLASSWAVCAAFVFGDHLGFCAGVNKEMLMPVIAAKLVAGISAVLCANFLSEKLIAKAESAATERELRAGAGDGANGIGTERAELRAKKGDKG